MISRRLYLWLTILILTGAALRFYHLNWDGAYFFHPDERNIAGAVVNLNFSTGDFNPNFFAYGSLPIYIIRAVVELLQTTRTTFLGFSDPYSQAILTSRLVSALLSSLLILLVFLVALRIMKQEARTRQQEGKTWLVPEETWALLAALLTAFCVGLIQFAHFGTFEIWLAFEYLLILFFALQVIEKGQWLGYTGLSVALAMALATKIVSLALVPILPMAWLIYNLTHRNWLGKVRIKTLLDRKLLGSLMLTLILALLFAPYQLLDLKGFRGSMNYEGPVATGKLLVFYTQQFLETTPILYQLSKVFPYILGLPLTVLALAALFYFAHQIVGNFYGYALQKKGRLDPLDLDLALLLTLTLLYLVPHFAFFVKWTRYMIPALPLLIILVGVFLYKLYPKHSQSWWFGAIVFLTIGWTITQGLNFFTIYQQPDPRIQAAEWAQANIPANAKILSEAYDLGIVPWNAKFPIKNITLYKTFNLDDPNASENPNELRQLAKVSQYIVIPSQRVYVTRLRLCGQLPNGCRFYTELFDGRLGYQPVARFSRPSWWDRIKNRLPKVPLFNKWVWLRSDETFVVFDHPTVLIFKRKAADTIH